MEIGILHRSTYMFFFFLVLVWLVLFYCLDFIRLMRKIVFVFQIFWLGFVFLFWLWYVLVFCAKFRCLVVVLGLVVIFCFLLILPRWVVVDVGRGYLGKSVFTALSSPDFPPDLGGWKLWAQERKLSPGFSFLPIFSLFPNSGKHCFPPYFPTYVFHPLYFHSNQTQCKYNFN